MTERLAVGYFCIGNNGIVFLPELLDILGYISDFKFAGYACYQQVRIKRDQAGVIGKQRLEYKVVNFQLPPFMHHLYISKSRTSFDFVQSDAAVVYFNTSTHQGFTTQLI